ncbi:VPLPA-CTERM sorting domain-containing protein [Haliea sp. E17]|uniref:VPLPA-CTERM sorting domain-containing protein n=1 Tax=Haliea sp. E17 TaxID=3401576 RepID=UPI003AAD4EFA
MNKVKTFASAAVLALAAGQASAAVIDVTAVITGIASGGGAYSETTGSAIGTYDDVSQILTLNYTQQQDTSAPVYAVGVMELSGQVIVDFSGVTPSAQISVTDCNGISGFDACFASGSGTGLHPTDTAYGTWTSFTTETLSSGANAVINYAVTPSAVPLPAAAWLFGSGLLGLAGVARRRKAA